MNNGQKEQREAVMELSAQDLRVRAGFRLLTNDPIAGGPVELEFFIENHGSRPLHLGVSGDRMRRRPARFNFEATFAGSPLEDPMSTAPDLGGPLGIVQVSKDQPWRQPLLLNDFLRLEETPGRLAPGESGRLELTCRRPLVMAASQAEALAEDKAQMVAVDLAFNLRRDDEALVKLSSQD